LGSGEGYWGLSCFSCWRTFRTWAGREDTGKSSCVCWLYTKRNL